MDPRAVVHRRLYAQRLAGEPFETAVDAVRAFGAMQAQEFAEAKWSIAQRVRDHADADVERAFADGDLLRTHALRPTWHFVAREDIRWILALTSPRVHARTRYYYAQHELDDALLGRTDELLARALEDGEARTRAELRAALAEAGIVADGPRLGHIVMHAELEALICSGPRRGAQHTYMSLAARAPGGVELGREAALAELTRRYFSSHGPATPADFAWWSGLTVADARAGLALAAGTIAEEVGEDGASWFAAAASAAHRDGGSTGALLVPMYDESVVAYKGLRVVLAAPLPRAGLLERPIVIDDRTVGSWRRTLGKRSAVLEATLFTRLGRAEARALRGAAERFARFLELPVTLETQRATRRPPVPD